ncbi:acyltransferase family protein [Tardiphaga robiniae]|uniref:Acyltransferase n=1 Tax=Tardiphaga robiniae TaxID=943830 RepID=A0A7G6TUN4_9BRAD|nr:acyltransferase [Tardiphaga robiniae]QND70466.1 acyltransferase [Tardiphaga robiniae]
MLKETTVNLEGGRVDTVHFYLLDILRGFAALAVVIWHYQCFFFQGVPAALPENFDRSLQPFYALLSLFYNEGSRAVQLFFVLSGFIFFSQYLTKIRARQVDGITFLLLRLTRLYPLYFVTLVAVAVGQWTALWANGAYFVYPCNSILRFIPSLLLISEWLPQKYVCSVAFNGPGWSLSVEAFLYLAFFLFARFVVPRRRLPGFIVTLGLMGVGIGFDAWDGYHLMGEPMICFFAGGAVYFIWDHLKDYKRLVGISLALGLGLAAAVVSVIFGVRTAVLGSLAYPSVVLLLAILQTRDQGRKFRLIGDITYSVYLLHFPIQLYVMLILSLVGLHLDFYSPFAWLGFFTLLIVISVLSYEYFERPAQRYLRRALIGKRRQMEDRAANPTMPRPANVI